jgi:hypothetical protein
MTYFSSPLDVPREKLERNWISERRVWIMLREADSFFGLWVCGCKVSEH